MTSFPLTSIVLAAAMALALPTAAQTGGAAGGTGSAGQAGGSTGPNSGTSGNSGPTGTSTPAAAGTSGNAQSNNAGSSNARGTAPGSAKAGAMAAADRTFMVKAAGSGLYEVQASRLAAERASSSEVKDFAQMMVSDHEKANQELMALASARGVALPQEMPADKRQELDRLSKAKNFDAQYMKDTGVKEHKAAVSLFETASKSAKDAELKAWAAQKLPTLREHLAHAQTVKPGNGKKGATSSNSAGAQGGGGGSAAHGAAGMGAAGGSMGSSGNSAGASASGGTQSGGNTK